MTRRLSIPWPDPTPFSGHAQPIRILAVSDDLDPALHHEPNREALGPVDMIVGCGDLDADDLCFLADAFRARLLYVLGNHDRGTRWSQGAARLPSPVRSVAEEAGLRVVGLSWPGHDQAGQHARRDDLAAWRDVGRALLGLTAVRLRQGRARPVLVISHAAPRGLGDGPDRYHAGFAAYRWLLERLHPPLWLHGHTPLAAANGPRIEAGRTTLLNVTGSMLIELVPQPSRGTDDARARPTADRAP